MEKVCMDVAEQEFERFAEKMYIDTDESAMREADADAFNDQKRKLVLAIMRGDLVIDDEGYAVYTPCHERSRHKEPLTFKERTGASIMLTDRQKQNQNVKKMYTILGSMCGTHESTFSGMCGIDCTVCEALFVLLMA